MLFYYLLFPQYISPLYKRPLLYKIECPALPSIPTIEFIFQCRIVKVPLPKEAALVGCLHLSKLFEFKQILRLVIPFDHLRPLVNHQLTRRLKK
jgi:hypothetical protein